jgi:hypothetical protein
MPHRAFRTCVHRLVRQRARLILENRLAILPAGRDLDFDRAPDRGFGLQGLNSTSATDEQ